MGHVYRALQANQEGKSLGAPNLEPALPHFGGVLAIVQGAASQRLLGSTVLVLHSASMEVDAPPLYELDRVEGATATLILRLRNRELAQWESRYLAALLLDSSGSCCLGALS